MFNQSRFFVLTSRIANQNIFSDRYNLFFYLIFLCLSVSFLSRTFAQPLAEGKSKFLGCAYQGSSDPAFKNYWTQLTPENSGKFGEVAVSSDTSNWNWSGLDAAYNYAINNGLIFKEHCLIWGSQEPSWISSLDLSQQKNAVETWIKKVGERYPEMDFVDVVNEPMPGHSQPSYKEALGGDGVTGWDWVIWAFQKARQYMPNAKLILNEYNVINGYSLTSVIELVDTLKVRGLIDGVGVQGHRDQWENVALATLKSNLNTLAATGVPIYISELDVAPGNIEDDSAQLEEYMRIFPMIWEHPDVNGITIWGYKEGMTSYFPASYLVRTDGRERPAMEWLRSYILTPPIPNLISPVGTTDEKINPVLIWSKPDSSATSYNVQVSISTRWNSFIVDSIVTDTLLQLDTLDENTTYYWRVNASNDKGTSSYSEPASFTTEVITGIETGENSPSEFYLFQNYPNPFNPNTVISYQLAVDSHVTLKVYDTLGREVAVLANEEKPAGTYSFNFDAVELSGGVYYYQLKVYRPELAKNFVETKKLVILK